MARMTQTVDLEDPIRWIGPDSTATFDNSASNPTEHASSESLSAVVDEEDEELEDLDDDAAGQ